MTRIATARIARSARAIVDEFALECATCPFAALARELLAMSDADMFYTFEDADTIRAMVYAEMEYDLEYYLDKMYNRGYL